MVFFAPFQRSWTVLCCRTFPSVCSSATKFHRKQMVGPGSDNFGMYRCMSTKWVRQTVFSQIVNVLDLHFNVKYLEIVNFAITPITSSRRNVVLGALYRTLGHQTSAKSSMSLTFNFQGKIFGISLFFAISGNVILYLRRQVDKGHRASNINRMVAIVDLHLQDQTCGVSLFCCNVETILPLEPTRKPSIEAGIRRNAICHSTWNEI